MVIEMAGKRKPRIFLGLIEIAGHYRELAKGFRELGYDAVFVDTFGNCNKYEEQSPQDMLFRLFDSFARRRQNARRKLVSQFWRGMLILLKPLLFLYVLPQYDVFILGHNTSFLHFWDLPILKLFGKKIVYQFHGSDGRPRYLDGHFIRGNSMRDIHWLRRRTRKQIKIIGKIDRWADVIINIGPQGHFHRRPFVQWLRIGLASRPDQTVAATPEPDSDRPVRILHCPSDPEGKGTAYIRTTIEEIKSRRNIEYIEVVGQPNSVVRDELQRCDFVVDQIYADYGMAGFATEAAWFSKPVIVGGWAVDYWKQRLGEDARPPSCYCYPHEFPDAILRMIDDVDYRIELGQKARKFVETHWHPKRIAEKILQALDGTLPADWIEDPRDIRYVAGWGMPREQVREIVSRFVETFGMSALGLDHQPQLVEIFRKMINNDYLPPETGMSEPSTESAEIP